LPAQFSQFPREKIQFGVIQREPDLLHFHVRRGAGGIQRYFGGVAISPCQPAGAEVDPAVIADHTDADIHQLAPFQTLQNWHAGSARGLTCVVEALHNPLRGLDPKGVGQMVGMGVCRRQLAQHRADGALTVAGFSQCDEAGFVDGLFGLAGLDDTLHSAMLTLYDFGDWQTMIDFATERFDYLSFEPDDEATAFGVL
jgi:hypothetical protein